jgi:hypothetical protein
MIASSCLQGQLKIWDATNGEQVSQIDRRKFFKQQKEEYFLLQEQQQQQKLGSTSEMSTQPNSLNSNGSSSPPPLTMVVSNNKESTSSASSSMSTSPPKIINYSSTTNPKLSSIKNKINFNFSSQDLQDPKYNDFQLQYQKYFNQSSATILSNHLFSNGHGDSGGMEELGGSNEYMYHQYSTDNKLGFSNNSSRHQPKHKRNHSYSNTLVNRKNISFDLDYPINSATKSNRSSLSSSPHSSQFRSQQQQQQHHNHHHPSPSEAVSRKFYNLSPIWCLDFLDNLIVIGCADGRLEFWEGTTGSIKVSLNQFLLHK